MTVTSTYSVGVRFGRGAIGNHAQHAVRGLARAGLLRRLIAGADAPAVAGGSQVVQLGLAHRALKKIAFYEPRGQATDWVDALFDVWAQRHVPPCTVFHGWGNMCLRQARAAHRQGARVIVERASTHPWTQARLLSEEATRWNLPFPLTVRRAVRRAEAEYAETDFVIVPSRFAYDSHLAEGVPGTQLLLNPLGVDAERFKPPLERAGRRLCVLFVGLVSAQKGVPDLLEAWRIARLPEAELRFAGLISPEMPPLLSQFRDLQNVRFLGHIDPALAYREADLFAFPSIQEGSALVTYEAMASGLPVIVTPNSGSVARDGIDGIVIPPRDPHALAAALVALAQDPARRRAMGAAARRRVLPFTWQRYGDTLAEAHRRVGAGAVPDGPNWLSHDI